MTFNHRFVMALLISLVGYNANANTVYNLYLTFSPTVSVYGTLTTNGVVGSLQSSDILGYEINVVDTNASTDNWLNSAYVLNETNSSLTLDHIDVTASSNAITADTVWPSTMNPSFGSNPLRQIVLQSDAVQAADGRPLAKFRLVGEYQYQPYGGSLNDTLPYSDLAVAMTPYTGSYPFPATYSMPWELSSTATVATVQNLSAVPEPAAIWLFGSGLVGLFGFARARKKANSV